MEWGKHNGRTFCGTVTERPSNVDCSVTNDGKYLPSYPHEVNLAEVRVITRNLTTLVVRLDLRKKNVVGWYFQTMLASRDLSSYSA